VTVHRSRYDLKRERLKAYQKRSDIVSVNNNSKWLYIFEQMETEYRGGVKVEVKFLTEDTCFEYNNFFSSLFDSSYLDGMSGPVEYNQLEWIKVYSEIAPKFEKKIEIDISSNEFIIYGYKRVKA
jgi:hypothetical protein